MTDIYGVSLSLHKDILWEMHKSEIYDTQIEDQITLVT